jgi:molecular chaperone GrpE
MATKRRTDNDSPRQAHRPDAPAVEASATDDSSTPGGARNGGDKPKGAEPAAQQKHDQKAAPKPTAEPSESESAAVAAPERTVQEVASQLEEANGRHLRLAADFENYKKRIRQEQLDTMKYAAATVAERLLPVVDDADRALSHAPEGVDESWLKGVRLTFQKLEEVLGSVGVVRIEALGAQFDPKQHEAVASEETSKHPEDTVVAELRAGYRMHDRVLRPALVKVARPPA